MAPGAVGIMGSHGMAPGGGGLFGGGAATPFDMPGLHRSGSGGSSHSAHSAHSALDVDVTPTGGPDGPDASPKGRGALRRAILAGSTPEELAASAGSRGSGHIAVRVEQPVQGLTSEPFTLLRGEGGELVSGDDERVTLTWERGARVHLCANDNCWRLREDGAPDSAASGPPVQCSHCLRHRLPLGWALFCSPTCMKDGWATHTQIHRSAERVTIKGHEGKRTFEDIVRGADPSTEDWEHWHAFLQQFKDVRYNTVAPPASRGGAGGGAGGRRAPQPKDDKTESWTRVFTGRVYRPTELDVGHRLRIRVRARTKSGTVEQTALTKCVLPLPPAPPPRRPIYPAAPLRTTVSEDHGFRVMTHNVLAEIYATKSLYPYCPLWALAFNYRRRLMLADVRRYDPDILCLQEVQADHFEEFYYPELQKIGYEGLYKQKTREPMGMEGKVDGCATFFRSSRFSLSEKYVIEFNDAALQMSRAEKSKNKSKPPQARAHADGMLNKALQRLLKDNVAQVVVLEMTRTRSGAAPAVPTRLCVSNTHVYWDPEYDDVKLWQTHMLIKELEKFTVSRDLPLILCGDFNSAPSSAVYRMFASNTIASHRPDGLTREDLPKDPCNILVTRGKLAHNLPLVSAHMALTGREPEFTNYTGHFVGCLDYAWFSADRLQVVAGMALPTDAELRQFAGNALPNQQYPSDHLSLIYDMMPHSAGNAGSVARGIGGGSGVAGVRIVGGSGGAGGAAARAGGPAGNGGMNASAPEYAGPDGSARSWTRAGDTSWRGQ